MGCTNWVPMCGALPNCYEPYKQAEYEREQRKKEEQARKEEENNHKRRK